MQYAFYRNRLTTLNNSYAKPWIDKHYMNRLEMFFHDQETNRSIKFVGLDQKKYIYEKQGKKRLSLNGSDYYHGIEAPSPKKYNGVYVPVKLVTTDNFDNEEIVPYEKFKHIFPDDFPQEVTIDWAQGTAKNIFLSREEVGLQKTLSNSAIGSEILQSTIPTSKITIDHKHFNDLESLTLQLQDCHGKPKQLYIPKNKLLSKAGASHIQFKLQRQWLDQSCQHANITSVSFQVYGGFKNDNGKNENDYHYKINPPVEVTWAQNQRNNNDGPLPDLLIDKQHAKFTMQNDRIPHLILGVNNQGNFQHATVSFDVRLPNGKTVHYNRTVRIVHGQIRLENLWELPVEIMKDQTYYLEKLKVVFYGGDEIIVGGGIVREPEVTKKVFEYSPDQPKFPTLKNQNKK
ncbi:MAG: hypothetical protein KDK51_10400, partial [Deltaproteobacteria bacterium]|nr:hypothetical protein [Deltaproteobacteria bacterium]